MTTLIDTNILVYAAGIKAAPARQEEARAVLRDARQDACLSLQVLSEFSAVALRNGLPPDLCRAIVADYRRSWPVVTPDAFTVDLALLAVSEHRLSFWGAMLWAVAKQYKLSQRPRPKGRSLQVPRAEAPRLAG
jgi:predicted nucleic acid-binding protein